MQQYEPFNDADLTLAADVLDDLEKVRIGNRNRQAALSGDYEPDEDDARTLGDDDPSLARFGAVLDAIARAEHLATLELRRALRRHPLGPWVKAQRGLGEKQLARAIATIGDPYIRYETVDEDGNEVPPRPRTVGELNAYIGLHVVNGEAPKRKRGQQSNWNEEARKRLWVAVGSVIKAVNTKTGCIGMGKSPTGFAIHTEQCGCGPWRRVYDDAREQYAKAVHTRPCVRCGPKGKPAEAGSELSDGHKDARARRLVMKAIAEGLWNEAKRIHDETPPQGG